MEFFSILISGRFRSTDRKFVSTVRTMNAAMSCKVVPSGVNSTKGTTFTGERTEMNINWENYRTDNTLTSRDLVTMLQSVFRWNVCLAMCIGCSMVYLAGRLRMKWFSDLSVVQFGILFPMVFVLTQAYNRRESSLVALAGFKSSIYSLYWIHRDWALADDDTPQEHKIRHIENTYNTLMELVCNFRCFLQTSHHTPSHHIDCYHDQVYKCISQLTVLGRQSFLDECINEASLFRYEVMRQKLVEVCISSLILCIFYGIDSQCSFDIRISRKSVFYATTGHPEPLCL